jgi:hypothetical protein
MKEIYVEYDFDGNSPDDLPCKSGTKLVVEKEVDDWYYCKNITTHAQGWIPKSFCKESIISAQVVYCFIARKEDELSCDVGQIVEVLDQSDNDWWTVRIGEQQGLVPSSFLKEIQEDAEQIQNLESEQDPFEVEEIESKPSYTTFSMVFTPSSVDFPEAPEILEEIACIEGEDQNHKQAINELIQTEISYNADLHTSTLN